MTINNSSQDKYAFYGKNIKSFQKDENCMVFIMKDATGKGIMTSYDVFPGIKLMYNDFHMQGCFSEFRLNVQMLAIDHCREGRIEFLNGSYMYLNEGDLQISTKSNHVHAFGFPLHYYQGITIGIHLDEAIEALASTFEEFSIDLQALREKFNYDNHSFMIRTTESIQHIFSELYSVPEKIRIHYYRIKILELLLFLSAVDVSKNRESRPYFPKKQVDAVKKIMDYIRGHMDQHITLIELSNRFDIPLTAMKNCFKAIYGQSIYAYLRTYRIEKAAYLLRKTDDTITTIAGRVGYSNPSKFAAAFKEIKGMPPTKYQKNFV
ncbi:helix-turn-helix domain-containing protein [Bacillus chungangensis]|uniref:AraC-like DNA-binding protein n=1 Tax=Bacillus chungangensis TaxID=587633 RepID=A0ABT9WYU2_9BACI|nr:AraC family transcriptional regulator [Bacillus chungangensis]MDQ0178278.1 AraC-like DNA-binding protein [Bacillus chungangensis]